VQSALMADCLPGFAEQNRLTVLDETILPRIWLGSAIITPAHFDESNNIACVVSGRRRFTLFPPEQVANLYVGPLDYAPTGTPISMVAFREPDFQRFPRFRQALAAAQVAELEPGDALYIPTLWWHHVESLAKYNVLTTTGGRDRWGRPNGRIRRWAACCTACSRSRTCRPSTARRGKRFSTITFSAPAKTRRHTFPSIAAACWARCRRS
jgi:hypothetical protein